MTQISVLLVDDHAIVRAGYRQLISTTSDISVIGEAATAEECCKLYQKLQPDVVVMDLNLPGMSGLETIRRICGKTDTFDTPKVLAFSMHDEAAYVERALNAGASGYLSKSCEPELLIAAIYAVAKGQRYIEPILQERVKHLSGDGDANTQSSAGLDALSPREFDVFCLLAQGKPCKQAAADLYLSEKTVSNYATQIKNKLGVRTLNELTRVAYQQGVAF